MKSWSKAFRIWSKSLKNLPKGKENKYFFNDIYHSFSAKSITTLERLKELLPSALQYCRNTVTSCSK